MKCMAAPRKSRRDSKYTSKQTTLRKSPQEGEPLRSANTGDFFTENGINFEIDLDHNKMRNIENALTDLVEKYRPNEVRYEITQYFPSESRWIVNIYNQNVPDARLEIEVIDDNGTPTCCVLNRVSVGYRSMSRIMNCLMDSLEHPQNYW